MSAFFGPIFSTVFSLSKFAYDLLGMPFQGDQNPTGKVGTKNTDAKVGEVSYRLKKVVGGYELEKEKDPPTSNHTKSSKGWKDEINQVADTIIEEREAKGPKPRAAKKPVQQETSLLNPDVKSAQDHVLPSQIERINGFKIVTEKKRPPAPSSKLTNKRASSTPIKKSPQRTVSPHDSKKAETPAAKRYEKVEKINGLTIVTERERPIAPSAKLAHKKVLTPPTKKTPQIDASIFSPKETEIENGSITQYELSRTLGPAEVTAHARTTKTGDKSSETFGLSARLSNLEEQSIEASVGVGKSTLRREKEWVDPTGYHTSKHEETKGVLQTDIRVGKKQLSKEFDLTSTRKEDTFNAEYMGGAKTNGETIKSSHTQVSQVNNSIQKVEIGTTGTYAIRDKESHAQYQEEGQFKREVTQKFVPYGEGSRFDELQTNTKKEGDFTHKKSDNSSRNGIETSTETQVKGKSTHREQNGLAKSRYLVEDISVSSSSRGVEKPLDTYSDSTGNKTTDNNVHSRHYQMTNDSTSTTEIGTFESRQKTNTSKIDTTRTEKGKFTDFSTSQNQNNLSTQTFDSRKQLDSYADQLQQQATKGQSPLKSSDKTRIANGAFEQQTSRKTATRDYQETSKGHFNERQQNGKQDTLYENSTYQFSDSSHTSSSKDNKYQSSASVAKGEGDRTRTKSSRHSPVKVSENEFREVSRSEEHYERTSSSALGLYGTDKRHIKTDNYQESIQRKGNEGNLKITSSNKTPVGSAETSIDRELGLFTIREKRETRVFDDKHHLKSVNKESNTSLSYHSEAALQAGGSQAASEAVYSLTSNRKLGIDQIATKAAIAGSQAFTRSVANDVMNTMIDNNVAKQLGSSAASVGVNTAFSVLHGDKAQMRKAAVETVASEALSFVASQALDKAIPLSYSHSVTESNGVASDGSKIKRDVIDRHNLQVSVKGVQAGIFYEENESEFEKDGRKWHKKQAGIGAQANIIGVIGGSATFGDGYQATEPETHRENSTYNGEAIEEEVTNYKERSFQGAFTYRANIGGKEVVSHAPIPFTDVAFDWLGLDTALHSHETDTTIRSRVDGKPYDVRHNTDFQHLSSQATAAQGAGLTFTDNLAESIKRTYKNDSTESVYHKGNKNDTDKSFFGTVKHKRETQKDYGIKNEEVYSFGEAIVGDERQSTVHGNRAVSQFEDLRYEKTQSKHFFWSSSPKESHYQPGERRTTDLLETVKLTDTLFSKVNGSAYQERSSNSTGVDGSKVAVKEADFYRRDLQSQHQVHGKAPSTTTQHRSEAYGSYKKTSEKRSESVVGSTKTIKDWSKIDLGSFADIRVDNDRTFAPGANRKSQLETTREQTTREEMHINPDLPLLPDIRLPDYTLPLSDTYSLTGALSMDLYRRHYDELTNIDHLSKQTETNSTTDVAGTFTLHSSNKTPTYAGMFNDILSHPTPSLQSNFVMPELSNFTPPSLPVITPPSTGINNKILASPQPLLFEVPTYPYAYTNTTADVTHLEDTYVTGTGSYREAERRMTNNNGVKREQSQNYKPGEKGLSLDWKEKTNIQQTVYQSKVKEKPLKTRSWQVENGSVTEKVDNVVDKRVKKTFKDTSKAAAVESWHYEYGQKQTSKTIPKTCKVDMNFKSGLSMSYTNGLEEESYIFKDETNLDTQDTRRNYERFEQRRVTKETTQAGLFTNGIEKRVTTKVGQGKETTKVENRRELNTASIQAISSLAGGITTTMIKGRDADASDAACIAINAAESFSVGHASDFVNMISTSQVEPSNSGLINTLTKNNKVLSGAVVGAVVAGKVLGSVGKRKIRQAVAQSNSKGGRKSRNESSAMMDTIETIADVAPSAIQMVASTSKRLAPKANIACNVASLAVDTTRAIARYDRNNPERDGLKVAEVITSNLASTGVTIATGSAISTAVTNAVGLTALGNLGLATAAITTIGTGAALVVPIVATGWLVNKGFKAIRNAFS
jgi:hypothetical protein